jgi:hypothetical protein
MGNGAGAVIARLTIAALLVLLLACPTAEALGPPPSVAAKSNGGKAKGKKKKCKAGTVTVKTAGRTRCLPVSRALPKPSAGDARLAIVDEALTPNLGHIPDPKNKIPPPMERVYRSFGPKALPAMEKTVGKAITRLDELAVAKASGSRLARGPAPALASEEANEVHGTVGNVTIDARLSIAADATQGFTGTAQISLTTDQGGGRSLRVTTEVPIRLSGKFGFKSPSCPTAEGKLDATDGIGITVRSELRSNQGKTLDEYYIIEVDDSTEMQGIVADDAKLDTLEIRSIEDVTEKAGGSIWGGSIVKGSIVRNTVVDMRTGQYDPHVTVVSVGVVLSGILNIFSPAIRPLVADRLRKSADRGFAKTVDFEMKKYRELEEGWTTPNTCAKLEFGRKNGSLTLSQGEGGDETVKVNAVAGGSPATAKWSLTEQTNGTFSLSSDSANPSGFHYTVTHAGDGIEITGKFKATSKAGVAEDSWVQKTKLDSTSKLVGNFSGEMVIPTSSGPSLHSWNGFATFERTTPNILGGPNGSYALTSGSVTYHLSGIEAQISACHWSGTATVILPAGPASGAAGVLGTMQGNPPQLLAPYGYSIQVSTPFGPQSEIEFVRTNCPEGAEELEETSERIPFGVAFETGPQSSADGLHYAGTREEDQGETLTEAWVFEAKP